MNVRSNLLVHFAILFSFLGYFTAGNAYSASPPSEAEFSALEAAISDISQTYTADYPNSTRFLRQLAEIKKASSTAGDADIARIRAEFDNLRRTALIANPLVSSQPILYVVRRQYRSDHHNTATMFVTGEINTGSFKGGGALKAIDLSKSAVPRTLLETSDGLIRDPEVSFDGSKIIFSMRKNIRDDYHIYEINADGTGLKALTSAPGVADFDPLYLPDGGIVFSSTREPKFCMCNRHIMGNLFRMDGDGANIHQIGKSTLHEGHSALLPDGRIIYDRWEYVDRNFGDAQALWAVNPDGTNHCIYWGNNTWSPGGVIDARAIPGTEQVMCVFGSCHDLPWGALAIIDRRLGVDGREPVVRTWPDNAINLVKEKGPRPDAYGFDNFKAVNPKYEDPYPLSEKYFLCSRMTGNGEQMGIYLLDVFGNEILLHYEDPGCYDPMTLARRDRPLVVPPHRDFANEPGYFFIADVYQGTHMEGVKAGSAKYLRVIESPEKRFWTQPSWGGQGVHCPAMNWHGFENKRILGVAPIAEGGSVYFEVPSDRFVYFQILDENMMMVQSMRSGTLVQSGEQAGCVGCHDDRRSAPPPTGNKMPTALKKPAVKLKRRYAEPRMFNYIDEVQPIFDKHCVRCHDFDKKAGKKLILAGDRTNTFNASYNELWRKKYIKPVGAGPSDIQPAYAWGSHASKIIAVIRKGHNDVKVSQAELERLATWIDINGPYYPRYDTAYPDNLTGRSPLNNGQIKRLTELTGVPFAKLGSHGGNRGPQISFDRPQISPCLKKFESKDSPDYVEAIAIIEAGKKMLAQRPRADMHGFAACPVDQKREEKYTMRQEIEMQSRRAISTGRKVYDAPIK